MDHFDEKSSVFLAHKRFFIEFLENEELDYKGKIGQMIEKGQTRLLVNLRDLRSFDAQQTAAFLQTPIHYFAPFQMALREYIRTLYTSSQDYNRKQLNTDDPAALAKSKEDNSYTIGIEGNFGANRLSPRALSSAHIGELVCIEGITTCCSLVRPKLMKTVHYCEATSEHSEYSYHDNTSLTGLPTSTMYPTKDSLGRPLTTEFGFSSYADHQTLTIQEMPERAPAGLLPCSIDVVVENDLVDKTKPGDRVQIIGIYRALATKAAASSSAIFRTVLIANHIRPLVKSVNGPQSFTTQSLTSGIDITKIQEIAKSSSNIFNLLASSIAPSIYGHSYVKQALLLQLLGGVEKNLDNGTHIRGDINVLMIGDPSTAKSQLLRFVLTIAPLAVHTTGRGSSGVGLTAAVTHDKETGERTLEAGAMVLADRGVVCIDEFDKMSDGDRTAIHEIMEQQTISINKANIHMTLNARCAVVAAANPRYSHYDPSQSPSFNINLPDSLLSRFDLLFIILDTPDAHTDAAVADRVLQNHQCKSQKKSQEWDEDDDEETNEANSLKNFERLTGNSRRRTRKAHSTTEPTALPLPFLKKYIEYAKANFSPLLTAESAAVIGQAFSDLRISQSQKKDNSYPITPRSLETMIRLSTAHAKARLSHTVDAEDVEVALRILRYALNHDSDWNERKEKETEEREEKRQRLMTRKQEQVKASTPSVVPAPTAQSMEVEETQMSIDEESEPIDVTESSPLVPTTTEQSNTHMSVDEEPAAVVVTAARVSDFQRRLVTIMRNVYEISIDKVEEQLNQGRATTDRYSRAEIEAILRKLEDDNKVMYRRQTIYRI